MITAAATDTRRCVVTTGAGCQDMRAL
jgi:hypothetical protein